MLETNREWLTKANPELLKSYKKQRPTTPVDFGGLGSLAIGHEKKSENLPQNYISPHYYQLQQELTLPLGNVKVEGRKRFTIIGGTDGGHLLQSVMDEHDLHHVIVIESSRESFFRSLDRFDWPGFFRHFEEKGGTIYFHIGEVTRDIQRRISLHIMDIGPHNASTIHYAFDQTPWGRNAIGAVTECLQDCINNLGFYDDERVGLAHSVAKLDGKSRFLTNIRQAWIDKPAMVCGNGPSLTKLIPLIKENREDMVLISCGTALGTLYRAGVKPDFHVEQERPKVNSNWTKLTSTPEFRKGITCIALNVVHPQTSGLFDDIVYALKANDFGAVTLKQYLPEAPQLLFVNPLAVNCGLAITLAMGFRQVYLAGADCAFAPDGASHAEGHKTVGAKESGERWVKGNFREKVKTNDLYVHSAQTLGILIQSTKDVTVYNLCDGARIPGTKPTRKFKARTHKPVTKEEILAGFKACRQPADRAAMQRHFTGSMFSLRRMVDSIPEKIAGKEEALFFVDRIYDHLRKLKVQNPVFWYLVKGSFTTQLVFLAQCAEAGGEVFDKSSRILKDFAKEVHEQIKSGLFEFDTWESNGGLPDDVNRPSS